MQRLQNNCEGISVISESSIIVPIRTSFHLVCWNKTSLNFCKALICNFNYAVTFSPLMFEGLTNVGDQILRLWLLQFIVQSDRKVTQPILKYFLIVIIQYNFIGLINTQYRRDIQELTQVTLCFNLLAPVRHVLFISAASVHCRTLPGISFLLNLPEWF
jgi:hypothetical protein